MGWGLHPGGGLNLEGRLHPEGWTDALPPPHRILRDTVNERAVRIVLECILVNSKFDHCAAMVIYI